MTSETSLQHRWLALTALAVGVSMIIVDATIVNVALPTIIDDLGIHLAEAEWITTIYILVFASLLITSGRVGDLTGRRRLFRIGLITFVGASMLAGLARSGGWLIGARFIQGIGASMTLPSALSIVNATFRGRDRGIAFGVWGSVIGGMAAIGPLLGGWVTSSYSWRWAFYINVPIGVLVWIGVSLWVQESRDEHAIRGFDIPGVLLIGTGLAALVFSLIEGPRYGWWIPVQTFSIADISWPLSSLSPVPFAEVVSVVALFAFAYRSLRRYTDRSLIDPTLFKLRSFRYGNIVAATRSFGEFGLVFVLPLFLAGVVSYNAFHIGVALVPLAAGAFIGGPLAAYLAERFGPGRAVTFGMFLEGISVVIASLQLRPGITGFHLAPALFIYGIGIGIAAAQLTNVILAEVPKEKSGQASGIQSTSRQIGSALGIALLGSILAISLGTLATKGLATVPGLPQEHQTAIVSAFRESGGQVLSQLRDQPQASTIVPVLDDTLSRSARRSGLAGAAIIGIGFLMSWMLPDTRTEEQKEERSRKRRTSSAAPGT
jgi:EmrB/QacA subfamily drug resistance transporter